MAARPFALFAGVLAALTLVACALTTDAGRPANWLGGNRPVGFRSVSEREAVLSRLPLHRLTQSAQARILQIAKSPTLYRRLPTQAISCDRDLFLFLTRNPDVMIGMWDLMGITNVRVRRNGPYQIEASDGSGTTCTIDLVYGDASIHIFVAEGSYDGKLVAKPVRGSGVFIVTSGYATAADGRTSVTGTIDCYLQLKSLGADLLARTFGRMIGRSADHNFVETANFVAQVSQAAEENPAVMIDIARRLPQVDPARRSGFARQILAVAANRRDRNRIASR